MITQAKKILLTLLLFLSGAMMSNVYAAVDLSGVTQLYEGRQEVDLMSESADYSWTPRWISYWNIANIHKYVATEDGILSIYTEGSENTMGKLWEEKNVREACDAEDYSSGSGANFKITYKVSKGNTYYFGARALPTGTEIKGYTLVIELESTSVTINDKSPLSFSADQEDKTIVYNRTFNNTNWQPLFVPFTMVSSDWTSQGLEVACIDNFHEYNSGEEKKIVLEVNKVASGMLYANTPYLIRATETGDKTITLSNATVYKNTTTYPITCSSMKRTYSFVGTYESISSLDADNNLILSGGKLMAMEDGATLSPQRWYVKMEDREAMVDAPTASPTALNIAIQVVGETNVTGIENIRVKEDNAAAPALKGIYDLQGRKLTAVPSKGVFIVDGKKYVK